MEIKVRFNYDLKLRCVYEVLKSNLSIFSVAKENNFDESNLRRWIIFHQKYGKTGLLPRKNQNYSVYFKIKVIQTIQKNSLSLREACVEFDIPSMSVIIQWQQKYKLHGKSGLIDQPKGRPKSMNLKKSQKEICQTSNQRRRTFAWDRIITM